MAGAAGLWRWAHRERQEGAPERLFQDGDRVQGTENVALFFRKLVPVEGVVTEAEYTTARSAWDYDWQYTLVDDDGQKHFVPQSRLQLVPEQHQ